MLDNLTGSSGVPSEELINDIKSLCRLSPKDLREIAKVFAQFGKSFFSKQSEALKIMEKNVTAFHKDRKLLTVVLPASGFILHKWAQRDLTREQVVDDLVGIGISDEEKAKLEPLLDSMEKNVGSIRDKLLESHAESLGLPRVESVTCACDARAVFRSNSYEEDQGDEQPYFVLNRFIPVAILEIVTLLNEEKTTHSFLLDEEELEDLCNVLQRARKRIERVKAGLGRMSKLNGDKE